MKLEVNTKLLGNYIKNLRSEDGWTLQDVADQTGMTVSTIHRVEKGGLPDINSFATLCYWLDEPMELFIKKSRK